MQFIPLATLSKRKSADVLVIPFWKKKEGAIIGAFSKELSPLVKEPLENKDFTGDLEETFFHYSKGKQEKRLLLLGLGASDKASVENIRKAFASAVRACHKKKIKTANVILPEVAALFHEELIRGICEGMLLANYQFVNLKHDSLKDNPFVPLEKCVFVGMKKEDEKIVGKAKKIISCVYETRDLVNGNADLVTPEYIADFARKLAKTHPTIKTTVFDKKRIEKEKMGLLLAVGRAAENDPALIISSYKGNPESKEHIVLVGKGITYDTGGLSLKTVNMEQMKSDMAGGATVLGALAAASMLGLKRNITAIVPSAENAIGSKSYKLGDVYRSYSGKTVEITNTDAEGRLVLADAIAYAVTNLHPTCLIDIGTLTGGIVVAIGDEMMGIFSNDKELSSAFEKASKLTGEMVWPMPLHLDYKKLLKSDVADIKNSGIRVAHPIQAAIFINEFVGKTPWVHIDFAGPAFLTKSFSYHPQFATGIGVRLLVEFIEQL
ncbi:MAG TPA: leucyl aminopeptidase [Chlamydiales bacterium]|nr:leucyl aminopeptidase [Chlamydiales bacterium]